MTYIIRTLLALLGMVLIGWAPFMLFPGYPLWYGLALLVGQFAGMGLVMVGAVSRCWE